MHWREFKKGWLHRPASVSSLKTYSSGCDHMSAHVCVSCLYPCWMLNPLQIWWVTGQRSNIAPDSFYLCSVANYVIDPEVCRADSACKALIYNVVGTPTHWSLSFLLHLYGINRLLLCVLLPSRSHALQTVIIVLAIDIRKDSFV